MNIYMMGICGTAMGSLAGLLKEMGHQVRGSDQNVYPPMSVRLKELGIDIIEGYKPENLMPRPDLVIVGNVMSRNHPEVQALLQSDIKYKSLPEAMGEFLIRNRHSIVISGTHGKTTTTALCSWVTECCDLEPGFLIGGVPLNFPNTFSVGKGNTFVIEGDEYDTAFFDKVPKFIHYRPKSVILTSIEFDHADIYKDLDAVKEAFKKLMRLIPEDGQLIYQGEDENIKSILSETQCKNVHSYGVKLSEWCLGDIRWGEEYSEFDVIFQGKKIDVVQSTLFGEYNLLNSLAVYALAYHLKLPMEKVKLAFKTFKGVKRRQEIIGKPNGVVVIDDFAHHPTAVRVTIDGVRKRFKKSRILACFEPRSATSRRKVFQEDFAKALSTADLVFVSVPYDQSKIPENERFDSAELIEGIRKLNPSCKPTLGRGADELAHELKAQARSGDVILLMSNGGFGGIYSKLLS